MFVSKAKYTALLAQKEASDKHSETLQALYQVQIEALKSRIEDLRSLVFSPTKANDVPAVMHEADQILSPQDAPIKDENSISDEELRERDRIFSGEYETI